MPATCTDNLIDQLRDAVDALTPHAYFEVELNQSKWLIEGRPAYCDRGRFLWHCSSKDQRFLTIDEADRFPRYFFGADALVSEMIRWAAKRGQTIVAVGGCSHATT